MESFGTTIRKLRKEQGLLLREVAALMEVDPSFLSRIEKNVKSAAKEHVIRLACILQADENELMIAYLSDKILYELKGEKLARAAIIIAEKKMEYLSARRQALTDQDNGQKII
jgi:transcriptional regulator with XRE-family HTH domain